ncbi:MULTISPECIES: DUF2752 domain-containing protein [Prauserella salsuginis group]|uniref:DUF2752 domain-containing protein n=1 Tax=Prauserella salsuginis TaxID=387889 RepID=A0ABW6G3M7_9PSEU|nr:MULTISPECIES: DUF2752 domain-containing protein [Prauserella salsuginis group]MCR3718695.1 Protein of unknown function (DUF2752) [Prauserella flava]MCR3733265.1 Protein of unknown function (DUF2752) [Prauserella salsuginis]
MSRPHPDVPVRGRSDRLRRLGAPAAVAVLVIGASWLVVWAEPTTPGGPIPACPTKALFGVVCPGCGAMRMIYSLLQGDLGAALLYNAVGVVAVGLLVWSLVAWTVGRWRGRPARSWQHWRFAPIVSAAVIAGWLVVRNLPVSPFSALAV